TKGTLGQHAAGAADVVVTDQAGKTYTFKGLFTYSGTTTTTPSTLATKSLGNMAKARGLHTATALDDGRVLMVGGVDATKGTLVGESEIYDPMTNSFTLASDKTLGGNPGGYMVAVVAS